MLKIGFGFLILFIRWRILIYGGIVRFFGFFVYLCVFNNNKVLMVFYVFEKVVNDYGMLLCVCFDKGVGNEDVFCYMLNCF